MKITAEQLKSLADLSGMTLKEGSEEKLRADLESILGYVERIQKLDLKEAGHASAVIVSDEWREDVVVASDDYARHAITDQFPIKSPDGSLEVSSVIGRDT